MERKSRLIAEFHQTDLYINGHSIDRKTLFHSRINLELCIHIGHAVNHE